MILGSQYLEGRATPDIYKVHPSYMIPIHIFNPNDSLLKAEELSKFACCVKCKLKKDPSVKAVAAEQDHFERFHNNRRFKTLVGL